MEKRACKPHVIKIATIRLKIIIKLLVYLLKILIKRISAFFKNRIIEFIKVVSVGGKMKKFISLIIYFAIIMQIIGTDLKLYTEISPPDQFLDKNGKLTGFSVEIVNEIQKRLGTNHPIEVVSWSWGYNMVKKEANTVLFAMTRTEERNPQFQWVGPISEHKFAFYGKKDSKLNITSLEDAKKVGKIGVYANDVRAQYLTKAGFKNLDQAYDQLSSYKKLLNGRVDMLVASQMALADSIKFYGLNINDFKLLYVFFKAQLYIAFSLNTPTETVKEWSTALESMKKDGSFEKILKKYYPNMDAP